MRARRRLGVLACAVVTVVSLSSLPANASPSGEAAALAHLKKQWTGMSMQQKLGTCNAYRRNANVMVKASAADAWTKPANKSGMTAAGWKRVYRDYFRWACSGAGRSPRP